MSHGRKISVTGLGYVGLPVAVALGKLGRTVAFDIDTRRVESLKKGHDWTGAVHEEDLLKADLLFTTTPEDLRQADFHIVAVPTPVDAANRPDLSPLLSACRTVGGQLSADDIVVVESTVYPGVTEEECVPVLEAASGLTCGRDFTVGYCPERINPGDRDHGFGMVTKVVSAQDDNTLETVSRVYEAVTPAGLHQAPNIKTAEAAKVIENTQRDLNIALMNELAIIFRRLGMDTQDVIEAAASKWNFHRFHPGLVGGHCIGVDPYYMTHRAELAGYHPQVILAGRRINDDMGRYVARETVKEVLARARCNGRSHQDNGRITVLGMSFKEDVGDIRNTRVADMVHELDRYGMSVQVHDGWADPDDARREYGIELTEVEGLEPADAVILAVPHSHYREGGWPFITGLLRDGAGVVTDIRGILDRTRIPEGVTLWRL